MAPAAVEVGEHALTESELEFFEREGGLHQNASLHRSCSIPELLCATHDTMGSRRRLNRAVPRLFGRARLHERGALRAREGRHRRPDGAPRHGGGHAEQLALDRRAGAPGRADRVSSDRRARGAAHGGSRAGKTNVLLPPPARQPVRHGGGLRRLAPGLRAAPADRPRAADGALLLL